MNTYIYLIYIFSFLISFINISNISAQLIAIENRKYPTTLSVYNVFNIVSQFSATLMMPIFAIYLENRININPQSLIIPFRLNLFFSGIGGVFGALFIPTIGKFMQNFVEKMYNNMTFLFLFKISLYKKFNFFKFFNNPFSAIKSLKNINLKNQPKLIFLINFIIYLIITSSLTSCTFASFLNPNYRSTSFALLGVINGLASIIFLLFLEPYNATLIDKFYNGKVTKTEFNNFYKLTIIFRILGIFSSQILFIPLSRMVLSISFYLNHL
jgi:hypothetical protein